MALDQKAADVHAKATALRKAVETIEVTAAAVNRGVAGEELHADTKTALKAKFVTLRADYVTARDAFDAEIGA